ncbi:MAG: S41 family peptidase [Leptospira sp.]|nr:S41 family peptidase [Leptospira sp.]
MFQSRIFYLFIGFSIGLLSFYPFHKAKALSQDAEEYLHILHEVTAFLETDYVEKVDEKELYKGAIQGVLSSLKDPHTRFMTKEEFSDLQTETRGSFGGLGIEVIFLDGKIVIVSPIDDTPASRAGLLPQDKIVEIDGKKTQELSLTDAIEAMRGEVGSGITLKIEREGMKTFDIDLVREKIKIQFIKTEFVSKEKIGYIRLLQFMGKETTAKEFETAIAGFQKQGAKGIIIDLRNNPGGLLDLSIEMAELFLEPGKEIVSVRGRGGKLVKTHKASANAGKFKEIPLVILVNQGSASASEILGGALKDHKRAQLLGSKTFGKGSVQNIYNLPYDTGVAITIQKYYTPSGVTIHGKGIEPDVSVEGITPKDDDRFYVEKLNRTNIVQEFTKKFPDYSEANAQKFIETIKKERINLSKDLARFIYFSEATIGKKKELINRDFDPQLTKAIEILSKK